MYITRPKHYKKHIILEPYYILFLVGNIINGKKQYILVVTSLMKFILFYRAGTITKDRQYKVNIVLPTHYNYLLGIVY